MRLAGKPLLTLDRVSKRGDAVGLIAGVLAVLFAFFTTLASSTSGASLTRGPYLQNGTPSSVVVRWRTDMATDSKVSYGPAPGSLNSSISNSAGATEHEITLGGLSANTKYYYSVGSSSATLAGNDTNHYFVTFPPVGAAASSRIWVLGDAGTQNSNQIAVRNAFFNFNGTRHTDLWLMLGDNAYNVGSDSEYQGAVFNMYPTMLRKSVLFSTLGNHETAQATAYVDTYPYFSIFTLPTAGEGGGVASGTEHFYSFDFGNIHFICLDSMTADRATNGVMATWLRSDLANTLATWIVAFWHHPPYTKGSHNSDNETELIQMRQNFNPILEAGGVDLVLSGHSHCYERSFLIDSHYGSSSAFNNTNKINGGNGRGATPYVKPPALMAHKGAVYSVAGSSGQTSGGPLNHPAMFVSLNVLGSVVLDFAASRLDFQFVNSAGAVQDYFTLLKDAPGPPTGLSATAGNEQIALSWNASTLGTNYTVKRATTAGGPYTTIVSNLTALSYTDTNVVNGTIYYYVVSVANAGDESGNSGEVSAVPRSIVVTRRIFYNHSSWDGTNSAATTNDDLAIATDKVALRRGQVATFTNYTSFSKGINGVMIDLALSSTPTLADFTFKVGNDNNPDSWAAATAPTNISVRMGAGVAGTDRVTLIWSNNAIQKQWLEVTVLPTTNTGLATPDIFYFGNAIGESGGTNDAKVDAFDEIGARLNPRNAGNPALIADRYDFNRDKRVDAFDQIIARLNVTTVGNALKLINLSALGGASFEAGDSVLATAVANNSSPLTAIAKESERSALRQTTNSALRRLTIQAVAQPPGPSEVSVVGRQLLVQRRNPDGTLNPVSPYIIRGVDWSPASMTTATSNTDQNNATIRRLEFGNWYQTDIPLLKNMNVNTVRTFMDFGTDTSLGPIGLAILDEFYQQGIMVIMTVDDANNDTNRLVQTVTYYRDHPAILMWSLGSEWNINLYFRPSQIPTPQAAAQRTEQAAQLVKSLDSHHPVATSYGDLDNNIASFANTVCSSVDVWSFNVYRGASFEMLFTDWAAISGKPMFLGEFGIDAFHSNLSQNPDPPGAIDEEEQKQYDLALWNEIHGNLSAQNPTKVCLGGAVFEWNDEWWKVSPWQSQQTSGWFPGGFPDGMASEDIFGILDIARHPRLAYYALQTAFDPAYVPSPFPFSSCRAVSRGSVAAQNSGQLSVAQFFRNVFKFYDRTGGGGGGRGFNLAALNPATGDLIQPVQNFDTWASRNSGTAHAAMMSFIDSLPINTLLMLSVADDAGLNQSVLGDCSFPNSFAEDLLQKLEALGSEQIRSYCYRSSWAMIAFKGEGRARAERVAVSNEVSLKITLNGTLSISAITDQFTGVGTPTTALPFEVGDGETPATGLSLSGVSSNPSLIPNENITFGGSGMHRSVTVSPATHRSGQAIVTVNVADGDSNTVGTSFKVTVNGAVAGRHSFYNHSSWDGTNSGATTDDDLAIATDKVALRRGQGATFTNYTSFSKGINGIMVDLTPSGALSTNDFTFKVGNDNNPDSWAAATAPTNISVRTGAGVSGTDRVTLIWSNNAIQRQWLEVTVLPTTNTGLATPDIFYFGNAIGETGNTTNDAKVDAFDEIGARLNPHNVGNPALIDDHHDFNRDKRVDAFDQIIARLNLTTVANALKLIDLSALGGASFGASGAELATSAVKNSSPVPGSAPAKENAAQSLTNNDLLGRLIIRRDSLGNILLEMRGEPGRGYRLEVTENPVSGGWRTLENAPLRLANGVFQWTVSIPDQSPQQFYRVANIP